MTLRRLISRAVVAALSITILISFLFALRSCSSIERRTIGRSLQMTPFHEKLDSLLVCLWLFPGWSPQGPRRRPLFDSKRILRCSHLGSPPLGWLRGLGQHESCQGQASSRSICLSRLSVLYSFENQVREQLR